MDEAKEILLNSLQNSGISLPAGVSSIQNVTPDALVSICSQSLLLIDDSFSFPTSLPDSMAERLRICTEISSAVKSLGYRGDLSFHQFLYPSDEDSYMLVRFLVEKLSKTSEGRKVVSSRFQESDIAIDNSSASFKDRTERDADLAVDHTYETVQSSRIADEESQPCKKLGLSSLATNREEGPSEENFEEPSEEFAKLRRDAIVNKEPQRKSICLPELEKKLSCLLQESSKMTFEIEDFRMQENKHTKDLSSKNSEVWHLKNELQLLKAAVEMAFDNQEHDRSHLEELKKQVEVKIAELEKLELQCDALKRSLDEKKANISQSFREQTSEVQEKLLLLEKVDRETKATVAEILKRDEENSKLSAELKNQPKTASRKSYIQRVAEITKNSKKQDADIERILKETRELQIESNSIQDRLHRTYAVVDEMVFRDAKNDPVRRQAYRLLTSIHGSFEQISEKILATDRTRREAAELEAKLAAMTSRSFDIDKLQADLDVLRRENDLLEQQLLHKNL